MRYAFREPSQEGLAPGLRFVILELVESLVERVSRRRLPALWAMVGVTVWGVACSDAAPFGTQRTSPGEESVNPALDDGDAGDPSTSAATTGPTAPAPSVDEVGDPFEEQGCPEAVQRIESTECDPLGGQSQCGVDEGCYPYVEYPSSRCEPETFGTRCDVSGPGFQGDPCSNQRCAHGFLCVVTGRGTECASLCRMPGPNTCPDGLICGSLDIDGFGVCI
jgi:hypothetical protein